MLEMEKSTYLSVAETFLLYLIVGQYLPMWLIPSDVIFLSKTVEQCAVPVFN